MRLKSKLKNKLRNWLLNDEFKKIENLELQISSLINMQQDAIEKYTEAKSSLSTATVELYQCRRLMNKICDVGIDVGFHSDDHSWAVICIAGRPEYVKFLPLNHKDTMEIVRFLKQFQYSNKVFDSPFGFKEMVENYILKGET